MQTRNANVKMFESYPDVVSFEQFRTMLGIGRNRAYELLRSGDIPTCKNGRNYIIAKIHVINYLLSAVK